jgi:hypothetical protein
MLREEEKGRKEAQALEIVKKLGSSQVGYDWIRLDLGYQIRPHLVN